jgi:hypothetical protein
VVPRSAGFGVSSGGAWVGQVVVAVPRSACAVGEQLSSPGDYLVLTHNPGIPGVADNESGAVLKPVVRRRSGGCDQEAYLNSQQLSAMTTAARLTVHDQ